MIIKKITKTLIMVLIGIILSLFAIVCLLGLIFFAGLWYKSTFM